MFRITSPKLLELFHTRTISQLWISAVKWHFNVNYRRPYWVVTLAEASLLSWSAAPVSMSMLLKLSLCCWSYLYAAEVISMLLKLSLWCWSISMLHRPLPHRQQATACSRRYAAGNCRKASVSTARRHGYAADHVDTGTHLCTIERRRERKIRPPTKLNKQCTITNTLNTVYGRTLSICKL